MNRSVSARRSVTQAPACPRAGSLWPHSRPHPARQGALRRCRPLCSLALRVLPRPARAPSPCACSLALRVLPRPARAPSPCACSLALRVLPRPARAPSPCACSLALRVLPRPARAPSPCACSLALRVLPRPARAPSPCACSLALRVLPAHTGTGGVSPVRTLAAGPDAVRPPASHATAELIPFAGPHYQNNGAGRLLHRLV
ncbi:MAG: hypothetical protein WDW36_001259 [Sanguina aurantia]